jgi:hypothetical protein
MLGVISQGLNQVMMSRRLVLLFALLVSLSAFSVSGAASAHNFGMAGLEAREELAGLLKRAPGPTPQHDLSAVEESRNIDDDGARHESLCARVVTAGVLFPPSIESRGIEGFGVVRPHRARATPPPTGPPST